MLSDRQPRGSPEGLPEGRNEELPARRRGVWAAAGFDSPPGSGRRGTGASREKPGEKAVTGRREYVETTNDTTLLKQAERRFESAPRARVYDRLFNF